MKFLLLLIIAASLLVSCIATRQSVYREEAALVFERISQLPAAVNFPHEVIDYSSTFKTGETFYQNGDVAMADNYYQFSIGKGEVIEELLSSELKRREEVARHELEQKRQLEAKLAEQARLDRERETARLKKVEADRLESRRRAEKARQERLDRQERIDREVPLVARHTVKRGETLPQIAALPEVFNDSTLWPLIYRANRNQISNPAILWPGQVLKIPRNSDRSDVVEARRFAAEKALR